jgi:hypothetical protein
MPTEPDHAKRRSPGLTQCFSSTSSGGIRSVSSVMPRLSSAILMTGTPFEASSEGLVARPLIYSAISQSAISRHSPAIALVLQFFSNASTAGLSRGTSRCTASQTTSRSMAKYPCTRILRMPIILCQGMSGARFRISSGSLLAASPIICRCRRNHTWSISSWSKALRSRSRYRSIAAIASKMSRSRSLGSLIAALPLEAHALGYGA